ncbi:MULTISPECIES: hypothetical protein [Comamonas]|jgi:hypothetical protein|uniref:hypothetical protein n=1 Tax=Comamonas TaxID=283 RepID=UPI00103DE6F7|nr:MULTISPECIES: hypothetical protein [Comamonas]MCO8249849.1 hypothetical protein [Comamonas thiooxydans]UBQ44216.1 hypothetical protein LCH15_12395 [Comamonas thiooxydans]
MNKAFFMPIVFLLMELGSAVVPNEGAADSDLPMHQFGAVSAPIGTLVGRDCKECHYGFAHAF